MNTKLERVLTLVDLEDYMDRNYLDNKGIGIDFLTFQAMMEKISTLDFSRISVSIYTECFCTRTSSEKIRVKNDTVFLEETDNYSTRLTFNESDINKIHFYISQGGWIDFIIKHKDEVNSIVITAVPK